MTKTAADVRVNDPLAGTSNATGQIGPFKCAMDVPLMVTLSGVWAGTVQVLRSIDEGATKLPLTVGGSTWGQFSGNACEPVWEESANAAWFYLDFTRVSGTLTYRLGHS